MNFAQQIRIDGVVYQMVDIQRGGLSAIYKDAENYLRIGDEKKITKDLFSHKKMEDFGFPVAKRISEGEYEDMRYFVEESLGDHCFGHIFKNETETLGRISDESFDQFKKVIVQFAAAQLKTIGLEKNWEDFQQGIHMDIICQELPGEKEEILNHYKWAEERLSVFPFGILHGDFTPFNIYPKGVIDLEDSFHGPVGYDVGALMQLQYWFPEFSDDAFHQVYKFTTEQSNELIDAVDSVYLAQKLPKVSDFFKDFNFAKGIWFAVRMSHLPTLQTFRYDVLRKIIS